MSRRRILVADCFPPEFTPIMETAGLPAIGETEVAMLASLDPGVQCDICYPADVSQALPGQQVIADYDGMLWSGTTLSVLNDIPEMHRQIELMRSAFAAGIPIFGICGGLQVAVAAAGGRVQKNPKGLESGIARQIRVNSAGHPMHQFRDRSFDAMSDHFDVVAELPEGGISLASNHMTSVQSAAFRVGDSEVWGVQYHPDFEFDHLCSLAQVRLDDWLTHGLIRCDADADQFTRLATRLAADPQDRAAGWLLGIGQDVIAPDQRRAEVRAWLKENFR